MRKKIQFLILSMSEINQKCEKHLVENRGNFFRGFWLEFVKISFRIFRILKEKFRKSTRNWVNIEKERNLGIERI